ncbi:hypothetical protein PKCBPO_00010 [Methylorubrum thiocyanatum]
MGYLSIFCRRYDVINANVSITLLTTQHRGCSLIIKRENIEKSDQLIVFGNHGSKDKRIFLPDLFVFTVANTPFVQFLTNKFISLLRNRLIIWICKPSLSQALRQTQQHTTAIIVLGFFRRLLTITKFVFNLYEGEH